MNVIVLSHIWPETVERLQEGHRCVVEPDPPEAQKLELLREAEVVILRSPVRLDRAAIDAAPRLKLILRAGMGLDSIDAGYAALRGIEVVCVPLSAESVAEHTIALTLALLRRIPWLHTTLVENRWEKHSGLGRDLRGRTLGLLGFGRIGRATGRLAAAFGARVIACDRSPEKPEKQGHSARFVDLDELFETSDVVAVQVPLDDGTRGLVDAGRIESMKDDALLIHVGRGGVVDEGALAAALKSGRLGGAALDVFEVEPPVDHPLLGLDNFVGTPHCAAQTVESQREIGTRILEVLREFES